MHLNIAEEGRLKNYGATSVGYQNGGYSGTEYTTSEFTDQIPKPEHSVKDTFKYLDVYNVNYEVKEWVGPWWKGACFRKIRHKQVLNNVTLRLKSGEITAILGNSGSGKTSLLDVITCRSSGKVTGGVYYNGARCTRDVIQNHATYVMQADRLLPNLTVRETLRYTASLKLPGHTSNAVIDRKVAQVITEMGLKEVADSRVGGHIIRGISGGEQRRVTIAIQLLKDPDMIFLDEPTSGLDSYTARYLVSNLRDLARRGKIVLLTIHQPSSEIFTLLDNIGIMSRGEMVYCGAAENVVEYFTVLGYPCDKYTNPLDKYVDVASIDRRDKDSEESSVKRVDSLVRAYRNSRLHADTAAAITKYTQGRSATWKKEQKDPGPSYPRVFITILNRMYRNLFRDRKDYVARLLLLPLFFLFILIFLGRLKHNQKSIQDRVGLLYQSATVPPFMGIINSIPLFPCFRDLYFRESRDGLYGTATFLSAYSLHVLPFHAISSVIFSSMVYWVTGMHPGADHFGLYTLEIFLLHYWGEVTAVAMMGLFMNANLAQSVTALLQAAHVIIASGFLKNVKTLVKPFQWLSWALIHRYSAEIFVANEFKGLKFDCDTPTAPNVTTQCIESGDDYIDAYYPGSTEHIARNFGILVAYDIGTLIIAIMCFKIKGTKNLH
ncbi:ATP-binding cassette sub-family G member 5-like [Mya arenaria]|nr:ATP-binding cassette sub-family G member 5-like [Mya arenaria]